MRKNKGDISIMVIMRKMIDIELTWATYNNLIFILQSSESGTTWVLNNFVQFYCVSNLHSFSIPTIGSIPEADSFREWAKCSMIDYQKISNEFIKKNYKEFSHFIKEALNDNWQTYTMFEHSKLFESEDKRKMFHKSLIVNYDDNKKMFLLYDNFRCKNLRYCSMWVDEDKMNKAFNYAVRPIGELNDQTQWFDDSFDWVQLVKLKNKKYLFNMNLFNQYLKDFISSSNSFLSYEKYKNSDYIYGLDVYKCTIKYLKDLSLGNVKAFDIRIFTMIRDSKKLMILRLEYFKCNFIFLDDLDNILELYNDMMKEAELILNKFIKIRVLKDKNRFPELCSNVESIMEKEKYAINELIKVISKVI